jgi:hypothetical protein
MRASKGPFPAQKVRPALRNHGSKSSTQVNGTMLQYVELGGMVASEHGAPHNPPDSKEA